jgi:mediator of RNA polymerase II transcription subunit 17
LADCEQLDTDTFTSESFCGFPDETCDLIYSCLHALLLRRHGYLKLRRLDGPAVIGTVGAVEIHDVPPLLQPIIDLLQYRVFCDRIKFEFDKAVGALSVAGIQSALRFDPVGETGHQLIQSFGENNATVIGGEVVLRIENRYVFSFTGSDSIVPMSETRHTIRLTFLSPSSLTAHLSQATLTISSIPQLCQLLTDEIERCLLQRICELGREICEDVGGTWFIDLSQCVGRWEGCVL